MAQMSLKPRERVPAIVARSFQNEAKLRKQQAYERRKRAREILFGMAYGSMKNLSPQQKNFVRQVHEEAYESYLHMMNTGESRYNGWLKRRQVSNALKRSEPISKCKHWIMWYGSQKVRWFRHDLTKAHQEKDHGTAALPE